MSSWDLPQQLRYVRYDFGHNYNQTSREAVYGWFNRWLLRRPSTDPLREPSYQKEPDQELRVFPDDKLPENAITEEALITYLKRSSEEQLRALIPKRKADLAGFSRAMMPAWTHSLQLAEPPPIPQAKKTGAETYTLTNAQDPLCAIKLEVKQPKKRSDKAVILSSADDAVTQFRQALLDEGFTVVTVLEHSPSLKGEPFSNFYTTYNRTRAQQRVRDFVTACAFVRADLKPRKVYLCGTGAAGLWALLASPAADGVAADAGQLNYNDENALLKPDVFYPGMKRAGGFQIAALLAAPNPLFVYNAGELFPVDHISSGYNAAGANKKLEIFKGSSEPRQVAKWLSRQ
jgi:hypothetical protein